MFKKKPNPKQQMSQPLLEPVLKRDSKCPTVFELQKITHHNIILTIKAVGLQQVLQEAIANVRIQEVEVGEQAMKHFLLTTLHLYTT